MRSRYRIWIVGVLGAVVAYVCFEIWRGSQKAAEQMRQARDARVINEIGRLSDALDEFRRRHGRYPPSRFKLCRRMSDYDTSQGLDQDSLKVLARLFPRLDREAEIDWSGGDPAFHCVVLQGDQCLVFFLGGLPVGENRVAGFSRDPRNPAAAAERETPLFLFDPERLVRRHGNAFYSYLDTYELQPYAYFSAYSQDHGYNRYFTEYRDSDCAALGVWPYAVQIYRPKYHNPHTMQILSAGADGRFGPGTVFPEGKGHPWSAESRGALEPEGRDDLSNFHPVRLGQSADRQR